MPGILFLPRILDFSICVKIALFFFVLNKFLRHLNFSDFELVPFLSTIPATVREFVSDESLRMISNPLAGVDGHEICDASSLALEIDKALGGNAVVGVRFDSNSLGENAVLAEFVAYGSAIVVKTG